MRLRIRDKTAPKKAHAKCSVTTLNLLVREGGEANEVGGKEVELIQLCKHQRKTVHGKGGFGDGERVRACSVASQRLAQARSSACSIISIRVACWDTQPRL